MPEPKTFWVTRDGTAYNTPILWSERPVYQMTPAGVVYSSEGSIDEWSRVRLSHWPALGLPQEPAPGECWEVTWRESFVLSLVSSVMVPEARNVTEELKERTDG